MRSLTKFLSAIALSVVASSGSADGQFKLSSLVVPQGVSYRFSQVRLTRDVEITDGTFNRNITEESLSSDSLVDKGNRVSQSANTRSHNDAVVKNAGASAGTSAHAEISLWSLGAGAEAHAEGHTKIEKDVSDVHHADDGLFETNRSETVSNVQHKNADNVVESSRGTHGNYYLVFTMTLKNLDLNDTYTVKAPADGGLRAILEGLGDQLEVPCVSAKSFTLDIGDERVCRFALKIVDEGLLAKLKNLKSLSDVRPKINGSIFPIVSDDTNKNILKEQRRAQLLNPTTEISLSFGKASMMSPWKVKRSYGKDSGRNGQKVTLRDALKAINEYVAAGDAMPEHVFEFDANEALWRVSEREFGKVSKDDGGLVGMNVGESLNGNVKLEKVGKDILDRPISDFPSIAFDEIDPKKIAEMYAGGDQEMKGPFQAMVKVLKNADEDDDIQHLFAYVLTQSPEAKDRELAAELLKKLFQAKNDVIAATWLVQMYFRHPKTCTYKSDLPEYVSFLIKNDKDWVSRNADSDSVAFIHERLIKDNNVPTLLAFLEEPRFFSTTNGVTVLMRLAQNGDVGLVRSLLEKKDVDINGGNDEVGTAIDFAAKYDKVEMCEFLFARGADPNKKFGSKDRFGTAVDQAVLYNATHALLFLLERAKCEVTNAHFLAAMSGSYESFKILMEKRPIDVNASCGDMSLLSYAASGGKVKICQYLVDKGARINVAEGADESDSPLCVACGKQRYEVVDYLLSKGAKVTYLALHRLIANGKIDWILSKVNAHQIEPGLPFLVAIGLNDVKAVEKLAAKVDINSSVSQFEWLPLAYAAKCDSVDVARALVKLGANVNRVASSSDASPMQVACRYGSIGVVKYLYLECGAILDDSLYYAVREKQKPVLDWFLAYERDGVRQFPVRTYSHGKEGTLLMVAAEMDDPEMCDYLLNKGADVAYSPEGKCSVIEWVVRQDNLTILKYFVDQRNYRVQDEILVAARYGSLKCLKYLIEEKRMPVNYLGVRSKNEGFLLGEAAWKGKTDVCRYLIEKGADVNFRPVYKKGFFSDTSYKTALEFARDANHVETVEYLISVGAK